MAKKNQPIKCNDEYKWFNGSINVTGRRVNIDAQRVGYGDGYFVAVCKNRLIYRSPDGITWEDVSPTKFKIEQHLFGVTYDTVNNVWIAAGRDGLIIKSTDNGKNWAKAYSTGSSDDLLFAAYGGGVILVVSEGGQVLRSTDGGKKWNKYNFKPTGQRPRCITFAKDVFAVGGYNGAISYSSDGSESSWKQAASGSTMRVRGIAYSPGLDLWVAGGYDICTSKDLKHWTYQLKISESFGRGDQVYCGDGGSNYAMLAGEHGMILSTSDPYGKAWVLRQSGSGGYILDITNNPDGELVVNVGNTVYKRSPDATWHFPFRYNYTRFINPNTSPVYVKAGNTVVNEIKAEYIPLEGIADLRAECHLRKNSKGHLWASIHYFGLYFSKDSGKTWSFKSNELVMKDPNAYSYFTILNDDTFLLGKVVDGWGARKERTPIKFYRSENEGDSWKEAGKINAAPFEGISEGTQNLSQLSDGTILYPVTRYNWEPDPEEPDADRENDIYRSTDGGRTWGDKSNTFTKGLDKYVWEPHIIQLQSGKLLGAFRYQRRAQSGDTQAEVTKKGGNWPCGALNKSIYNQLYIGESDDNGYTWKNLHDIRDAKGNLLLSWGEPHGTLLQVPDGRVVLVYDHRCEPGPRCSKKDTWAVSNRAVVSEDEGATWGPEIYHLSYGKGYPSSVSLDDGTIVTVTGNDLDNKKPYSAMAVRWRLMELPPKPTITVTSPTGGEIWNIRTTQDITWESTDVTGHVSIDYSIDNGASWIAVVSPTRNDGHRSWPVPDTPSEHCLIRIKAIDVEASGKSNAVFSIGIPPSIRITSPNGGERWETETEQFITWTTTGEIGKVSIKYSIDNGSSWMDIVSLPGNDGKHPWKVPGTPSGNCLVRIEKIGGGVFDKSKAVFAIEPKPQLITITSPNGEETWALNEKKNITWNTRGVSGGVKITLWKDGDKLGTIADDIPSSPGSYQWTVGQYGGGPASVGSGYRVRIKGVKKGERSFDDSNAAFSLVPPEIRPVTLFSPNGDETWALNKNKTITWEAPGISGNVKLTLWQNGERMGTIVNGVPSSPGSYEWPVGQYLGGSASPGTGYRIRVKGVKRGERSFDDSDAEFSIVEPEEAPVTVTSPDGGEVWELDKNVTITWDAPEISGNVKITLWKDGTRIGTIADNVASSPGVFHWTVGRHSGGFASAGAGYSIRVKGVTRGERSFDDSDTPFTLVD